MIIGLGIGLTMTPATSAITEARAEQKQGVASALNDTTREVGGAIGVALLGSILSTSYETNIGPNLQSVPERFAEPARGGIGSAFVEGWVQSMWVGVAMAALAIVYLVVRGKPADEVAGEPMDGW